ncbi:MAG: DUF2085 domain-containing protein [bacterium]
MFHLDKYGNCYDNEPHVLMNISRTAIYLVTLSLVFLWCLGIAAAPLGTSLLGENVGSSALYAFYSKICHQMESRSFHIGGEKCGVCIRCTAIYGSFLLGLALYPLIRKFSTTSVPHRVWFVVAVAPMIFDVALSVLGIHTSTWLTRTLAGAVFGLAMPWFLMPSLLDAVIQLQLRRKIGVKNTVSH